MTKIIEQFLYIDQQDIRGVRPCENCGCATYPPSYFCENCKESPS